MVNAKRASMREGPLAALFRKTEEDEASGEQLRPQDSPERSTPLGERASAGGGGAPGTHPRESGLPHPALSASATSAPEELRVPSPQERLRHAFSSEIPENVMDRAPAPIERAPAARPAIDDYAHDYAFGASPPASQSVGQPVIRVVGVGG
jgi:cell division protein FtsZ